MTAPSAVGTLAQTPLAHALIYVRSRRLSGRLELIAPDARRASMTLWRGRIVAVDTGDGVSERGGRSDDALVEEVHRKVHLLFAWGPDTRYAFYDTNVEVGGAAIAVDPVGPIWRGICDYPPSAFVEETIRRVGGSALNAIAAVSARLPAAEMALVDALGLRPMTIAEMKGASSLAPNRVELLVYLLVIAKCIEAVSGVRAHPSTGALPTTMPSGPMAAIRPSPLSGLPVQSIRPSGIVPTVTPSATRMSVPPARTLTPSRMPAQPGASTPAPAPARTSAAPPRVLTPAELGAEGIVARAAAIENDDYFHVLGVPDNASIEAVRAAYVRLAKTWHPDRAPSELRGVVYNDIAKIFSHMTRAQQTLCDAEARRNYLAAKSGKTKVRPRSEIMREIDHATNRRDSGFVVQLCQELIDNDADDAEAMARQAWASVGFGEADEEALRAALPKLERAVNTNRTDDQAVYHRGLLHKRLNNVPAAFRDFARAIQLNPKHVDAEREVRIFAMRARKDSGEHKLGLKVSKK